MSYLLISRSGKYFRDHPQEAIALIDASPTLNGLRSNPAVRKAVEENPKLKTLAPQLFLMVLLMVRLSYQVRLRRR